MRIKVGRWLFVLVLRREDPNRRRACPVCKSSSDRRCS